MPNGGSDCCGTCWFNAKNKGEAGYAHADDPGPAFCVIRDLPITEDPFYTYCRNHPHHCPQRDRIPIGPVFIDSDGARKVWQPSPDTEEIRKHLLSLLEARRRGRGWLPLFDPGRRIRQLLNDEVVVWQLGEFRETRAVDGLRWIAEKCSSVGPYDRPGLAALAREAIGKIEGGGSAAPPFSS